MPSVMFIYPEWTEKRELLAFGFYVKSVGLCCNPGAPARDDGPYIIHRSSYNSDKELADYAWRAMAEHKLDATAGICCWRGHDVLWPRMIALAIRHNLQIPYSWAKSDPTRRYSLVELIDLYSLVSRVYDAGDGIENPKTLIMALADWGCLMDADPVELATGADRDTRMVGVLYGMAEALGRYLA